MLEMRFSRGNMGTRLIFAAVLALSSAPAWAMSLEESVRECRAFEAEKASLEKTGLAADMEKGPAWASANLPASRLQQIERFIHVEEQLKFRCPEVYASAAVKEEEERVRLQAIEARLWNEKLAEFAKNPLPPERKPETAFLRAKARLDVNPPLPVRATR